MQSIRIGVAACAAALSWLSLGPAPAAEACTFLPFEDHALDAQEQAVDTTPPGAPRIDDARVDRRDPTTSVGCAQSDILTCDDVGSVVMTVAAGDDRTPDSRMGYVIRLVAGVLPEGVTLPAGPVRSFDGTLDLLFDDRDQPVRFTLSVRAVDLAGNEGPAVEVAFDDAPDVGGCRAGGPGPITPALLLAAIALVAARRRRRA